MSSSILDGLPAVWQLVWDLRAEIVIRTEEGHTEAEYGWDGVTYGGGYAGASKFRANDCYLGEKWVVDVREERKPDEARRAEAQREMQRLLDESPSLTIRYLAGRALGCDQAPTIMSELGSLTAALTASERSDLEELYRRAKEGPLRMRIGELVGKSKCEVLIDDVLTARMVPEGDLLYLWQARVRLSPAVLHSIARQLGYGQLRVLLRQVAGRLRFTVIPSGDERTTP